VYLTYSKKHRDDLGIGADKTARFNHLQKKLKFIGNLDEKQRLKEITDKYSVHKTLQNKIIIDIEIV
jgi:hypothetical protein